GPAGGSFVASDLGPGLVRRPAWRKCSAECSADPPAPAARLAGAPARGLQRLQHPVGQAAALHVGLQQDVEAGESAACRDLDPLLPVPARVGAHEVAAVDLAVAVLVRPGAQEVRPGLGLELEGAERLRPRLAAADLVAAARALL